MRYLTGDEILALHDRILDATKGLKGIRDVNLLYSIADKSRTSMFGVDFYPDVFLKAAVSLEALATYHVFTDGNKRAAFVIALTFLRANGYAIKIKQDEVVRFVMAVAVSKKSLGEIAKWLKKYSKKVS